MAVIILLFYFILSYGVWRLLRDLSQVTVSYHYCLCIVSGGFCQRSTVPTSGVELAEPRYILYELISREEFYFILPAMELVLDRRLWILGDSIVFA